MRSRGAGLQVKVDGKWLTEIANWGGLEYVLGWPGDCLEASWSMTARRAGARHPVFHRDAYVEINRGGHALWAGLLQEPDWNGRDAQITARGLYRVGEDYSAFNSSGDAIDVPSTAITAQIARGLPWVLDDSIPTTALTTGTTEPVNSVAALLDQYASHEGLRWGVDARRLVYMGADASASSTPKYHIRPGAGDLSLAADNFASHVILRHRNTIGGFRSAVFPALADPPNDYEQRFGHRDFRRDVTDLGPIDDAIADTIAFQLYVRSFIKPGFTNGLTLMPGELQTAGGVEVSFDAVRANEPVRHWGVRDEVTRKPYVDFTIGKITRRQGEATLDLDPVGVVSRTEEDLLTEILEQMSDAMAPA